MVTLAEDSCGMTINAMPKIDTLMYNPTYKLVCNGLLTEQTSKGSLLKHGTGMADSQNAAGKAMIWQAILWDVLWD